MAAGCTPSRKTIDLWVAACAPSQDLLDFCHKIRGNFQPGLHADTLPGLSMAELTAFADAIDEELALQGKANRVVRHFEMEMARNGRVVSLAAARQAA